MKEQRRQNKERMFPYPEHQELLIEGGRDPNAESAKNRNLHSTRPICVPSPRLQRSLDMVQLQLRSPTEVPDFRYQQAPLLACSPQFSIDLLHCKYLLCSYSAPLRLLEANEVDQRMLWSKAARRRGGRAVALPSVISPSVSQSLSHCGVPTDCHKDPVCQISNNGKPSHDQINYRNIYVNYQLNIPKESSQMLAVVNNQK